MLQVSHYMRLQWLGHVTGMNKDTQIKISSSGSQLTAHNSVLSLGQYSDWSETCYQNHLSFNFNKPY
jgi:hypothetical protein